MHKVSSALAELFWSKVDRSAGPDACWPWTAARGRSGRGQFGVNRKIMWAPRVVYLLAGSDIGSLFVLHTCDNPPCCNPKHLFLGTQLDNMRDMKSKGRRRGITATRGETHGRAKLSDCDVLTIRERCASGERQRSVAAEYGITQSAVSIIVRRKVWRHI